MDSVVGLESISLHSFSLLDFIDIAIVGFLIYKAITWIKDTKAWSLFRGAGLVLVISSGLSFALGLTTVWWLVRGFFSIAIIALVILFQPELRRALEEIGRGKLALPFLGEQDEEYGHVQVVDEILKAAKTLTGTCTGALIVMEKKVVLTDIENTGIKMDSLVSAELLLTIFVDKTPLHDGAVLVRNNRLSAASCILPLTEREIGKELGTRHRAAVGVSEAYQAVVLIVSEETGDLSIVDAGALHKGIGFDKARKLLLGEYTSSKRRYSLRKGKS